MRLDGVSQATPFMEIIPDIHVLTGLQILFTIKVLPDSQVFSSYTYRVFQDFSA